MAPKIIIIAFLAFAPWMASAKDNWELKSYQNALFLAGECSASEVRVDLFQKNNESPVYTSGAVCQEGQFEFQDNLLQWKSLADGEYSLVVDGDKKNDRKVFIQRPEEIIAVATIPSAPVPEAPTDPDSKFLSAFVNFQQSLLDMRTWLAETKYPALVKASLDALIDGVDGAAGKIADLLWSAETEPEVAETETEVKTEEPEATLPEVAEDPVAEAVAPETVSENSVADSETVSENLLSADDLEISGADSFSQDEQLQ